MNIDNKTNTIFTNQLQSDYQFQSNQTQQMSNFISIDENDTIYPSKSEINSNTNSNLTLKQQAMLNQFISIAGCSYEQAKSLLASSNWQYQSALSVFFDDYSIVTPPSYQQYHHLNRPLNPLNNNLNTSVNSLSVIFFFSLKFYFFFK